MLDGARDAMRGLTWQLALLGTLSLFGLLARAEAANPELVTPELVKLHQLATAKITEPANIDEIDKYRVKDGFPAMFGLLSSAPDERDFAGLECDQAIANRTESF